jgi:hypothetical protein
MGNAARERCSAWPRSLLICWDQGLQGRLNLRACESFANLWGMKGLQQVVVVLLRGWGEWSEGEPVGVGR